METILIIQESRFREILKETIAEISFLKKDETKVDVQITSIAQLAEELGSSKVTAQKIKNQLPRGSYLQIGRSFSISRNWLFTEYPKLSKNKRAANENKKNTYSSLCKPDN